MDFDHIGIIVEDLEKGKEIISELFPIASFTDEIIDPNINVKIIFAIDTSNIRYELVAPLNEGSPVSGALKARKNIINHVAYRTQNFDNAVAAYSQHSMQLGAACPAVAFDNKRVVFFMTQLGAIVELIER